MDWWIDRLLLIPLKFPSGIKASKPPFSHIFHNKLYDNFTPSCTTVVDASINRAALVLRKNFLF